MKIQERFISQNDYELLKKIYPDNLEEIIQKINNNYPIQYLIGYVDFYGYKINVDPRVLIPRYETEGLVDEIIKSVKPIKNLHILEVGTGSGCIAISLGKELNTTVDTIDISKGAIEVASNNGLEFYEIILKRSKEFLATQSIIAFEIGATKGQEITNIARNLYPKATIYVKKDLSNRDRYLFIINK